MHVNAQVEPLRTEQLPRDERHLSVQLVGRWRAAEGGGEKDPPPAPAPVGNGQLDRQRLREGMGSREGGRGRQQRTRLAMCVNKRRIETKEEDGWVEAVTFPRARLSWIIRNPCRRLSGLPPFGMTTFPLRPIVNTYPFTDLSNVFAIFPFSVAPPPGFRPCGDSSSTDCIAGGELVPCMKTCSAPR